MNRCLFCVASACPASLRWALGCFTQFLQNRDRIYFFVIQILPVYPPRSGQPGVALDDLVRCDYEIQRNIMRFQLDFLVNDLDRMYSRNYWSSGGNFACLSREPVLEVRIPAALADSRSIAADRNRSAQDQVDGLHLSQPYLAAELERAFYA